MTQPFKDIGEDAKIDVEITNLGGIDTLSTTIFPGITVLSGENATNRTSFLEAIATGLGGSYSSVKTGASEGTVSLSFGDEFELTRSAYVDGGSTTLNGDGIVPNVGEVAPFAWLFMDNEVRQAIRNGEIDRLASLAMRPVDTAEIDAEKRELKRQRQKLDEDITDAEEAYAEAPAIQTEITSLEGELKQLHAEITELEKSIDDADEVNQQVQQLESELNDLVDEKSTLEAERESVRDEYQRIQQRLSGREADKEKLQEDIDQARQERAEIDADPDVLQSRRQQLQSDLEGIEATQSAIDTVIGFTRGILDGEHEGLRQRLALTDEDVEIDVSGNNGGVSNLEQQLGSGDASGVDETLRCWTCGTTTTAREVESQLSLLKQERKELSSKKSEIQQEMKYARETESAYESAQRRVERLEENLSQVSESVDDLRAERDRIESQKDELTAEIESLSTEIESLEEEIRTADGGDTEIVELRERKRNKMAEETQAARKLDQRKQDLREAETQKQLAESLREEREDIQDQLTQLREKVEALEDEVVDTFNTHMDDLIPLLNYQNIEQVQITKKRQHGETVFDLELVRETADGAVMHDTLENLSESEREVVSIAFSLSGYLAHDIAEEMPLVLIDSIEMIDGQRINDLLSYFSDSAQYLIAALLEEDAAYVIDDSVEAVQFAAATAD